MLPLQASSLFSWAIILAITALHGSAKHCCMGRSAKYRKHEISTPPVEQNRVNRSKPKLAGVTTLGSTFDRPKNLGSIERWRPHTMAVCQTFVTLFCPTLFSPNQPTGQTSHSPTMYYASNDVVSLIHVPFGGKNC